MLHLSRFRDAEVLLLAGTSLWEWLSLGYDHPENQSAQERFPEEDKVHGTCMWSLHMAISTMQTGPGVGVRVAS